MSRAHLISAALLVLVLGIGSFARTAVFRDEITLWTDAAAKSPRRVRSLDNLGHALMIAGRSQEAFTLITQALALDPDDLEARFNLALLLYDSGSRSDAKREFSWIVEHYPHKEAAEFSRLMLRTIP